MASHRFVPIKIAQDMAFKYLTPSHLSEPHFNKLSTCQIVNGEEGIDCRSGPWQSVLSKTIGKWWFHGIFHGILVDFGPALCTSLQWFLVGMGPTTGTHLLSESHQKTYSAYMSASLWASGSSRDLEYGVQLIWWSSNSKDGMGQNMSKFFRPAVFSTIFGHVCYLFN